MVEYYLGKGDSKQRVHPPSFILFFIRAYPPFRASFWETLKILIFAAMIAAITLMHYGEMSSCALMQALLQP